MKIVRKSTAREAFEVVLRTRAAEGATMRMAKGESSDDELRNEHPCSEQWLYVVSGTGEVITVKDGKRHGEKPGRGALMVTEKCERHQVKNTGKTSLTAFAVYSPPAYDEKGSVLPAAQ